MKAKRELRLEASDPKSKELTSPDTGARPALSADQNTHPDDGTNTQNLALEKMLDVLAGESGGERVVSVALGVDPLAPSVIRFRVAGGGVEYAVGGEDYRLVQGGRAEESAGGAFKAKVSDVALVIQQAMASTRNAWAEVPASVPQANAARPEVYLHLDKFLQDIRPDSPIYRPLIRYALSGLSGQVEDFAAVHVKVEGAAQMTVVREILDESGLSRVARQAQIHLATDVWLTAFPQAVQIHLLPKDAVRTERSKYSEEHLFIAMERSAVGEEFILPAFAPAGLLSRILGTLPKGEALTAADPNLERARMFFQEISGTSVTSEEFLAWIQGTLTTRNLFLPALIRVKVSQAVEAARLASRFADASA